MPSRMSVFSHKKIKHICFIAGAHFEMKLLRMTYIILETISADHTFQNNGNLPLCAAAHDALFKKASALHLGNLSQPLNRTTRSCKAYQFTG